MQKSIIFSLLLITVLSVFPPPLSHSSQDKILKIQSICSLYQQQFNHNLAQQDYQLITSQYYLKKVLKRMNKNQPCYQSPFYNSILHIPINLNHSSTLKHEAYELRINNDGVTITFATYSGYIYALETLSQLLNKNQLQYTVIIDEPLLSYRGVMIDTARHFIGVKTIKKLIESMPLSKLNYLHWHIIDDQSFPIRLLSHPELSEAGCYSAEETYSIDEVKELIALAKKNGVQIIPEIDTPGHVRVWGLAQPWKSKQISIKCNGGTGYNGQFDVSKTQVFGLVKDVVREINQLFQESDFIHLGGDEVSSACWNLRPQIQNFMKSKNITNYGQLQMYWRDELKSVLPKNRRVIFWRNNAANLTLSGNDVLHFWGAQADVANVTANSTSQIILSPSDLLYLNKGHGNIWLNGTAGEYSVWKILYQKLVVFPKGVDKNRILGGEVCLWGEVSNEDTLQNNLWTRASAFAARVWSAQLIEVHELVKGLVQIQRQLYKMDVGASPIVTEYCEYHPEVCYFPDAQVLTS